MARREWADKKAQVALSKQHSTKQALIVTFSQALQDEHARAVWIVKRAKRLELHGLRDTDTNEFLEGYEAACTDILAALSKGRA